MPYLTMAAGPKGNISNAQETSLHFLFENNIKTFCFYGPLTEDSVAGLKAQDLLAHSCHRQLTVLALNQILRKIILKFSR